MFIFECYTHKKNALVLFLGQYSNKAKKRLSDDIQSAFLKNLTPELVLLIYPEYLDEDIKSLLSDDSFNIDLKRHSYTPIYKVAFNENGKFSCHKLYPDDPTFNIKFNSQKLYQDVIYDGFHSLMSKRVNDVIVRAPSGTIFVKPSGDSLEEFIYTSQLARNNFENQFIAMSLLAHSPPINNIDRIYIDTSSISAIAEALTYYLKQFSSNNCKQITYESFSSYSGIDKNKPDNVDGAWVIISASTSTRMGKRIVKDWHLKPEQVVTILSHSSALTDDNKNIGNDVVFCINKYSDIDKKNFSPTKVQVQGESFSAEVSAPDRVVLRKIFKPSSVEIIDLHHKGQTFSVNKENYTLYVDYISLRKNYLDIPNNELNPESKLYKWILKIIRWTVPKNLGGIIYQDNEQTSVFANDFRRVLNDCEFNLDEIKTISTTDQEAMSKLNNQAVLILAPAISTARVFVDVNRALRLAGHDGMRIFASAFVVAPSCKQFKDTRDSLTQGTSGFKYHYLQLHTIFLCSKNISSWTRELEVVTEIINQSTSEKEAKFWIARKEKLEKTSEGLGSHVGIAYTKNKILELSKDFVFWNSSYKPNEVNGSAVYATVGTILQNLRENKIDNQQLSSNIYKHAVLDPENFVRFNDPILQSCLWRCALPGELDYRRSDFLSSDFRRILTKIFEASNTTRGITSLDLLMGLATRWIKVSSSEMIQILESAELNLTKPHAKAMVRYMRKEFSR